LHGSECLEKKDGKVILKIEEEEGVTLEVIDHFLTFLYSGKLGDGDEIGPNGRPVWVGLLPQLVHMAHKVTLNTNVILLLCYTFETVHKIYCIFSSRWLTLWNCVTSISTVESREQMHLRY